MPPSHPSSDPGQIPENLVARYARLAQAIHASHRAFIDLLQVELEKRLLVSDINATEALFLYNLPNRDIPIGDLSDLAFSPGGHISRKINTLARSGWLTKRSDDNDKRVQLIRRTAKADLLLKRLETVFLSHAEDASMRIPHGCPDLDEIAESLDALYHLWRDIARPPCFRKDRPPMLAI